MYREIGRWWILLVKQRHDGPKWEKWKHGITLLQLRSEIGQTRIQIQNSIQNKKFLKKLTVNKIILKKGKNGEKSKKIGQIFAQKIVMQRGLAFVTKRNDITKCNITLELNVNPCCFSIWASGIDFKKILHGNVQQDHPTADPYPNPGNSGSGSTLKRFRISKTETDPFQGGPIQRVEQVQKKPQKLYPASQNKRNAIFNMFYRQHLIFRGFGA